MNAVARMTNPSARISRAVNSPGDCRARSSRALSVALVDAAVGEDLHRRAGLVRIELLRLHLHADLAHPRGKPIAQVLRRKHAAVVVHLGVSIDDVGDKRRDVSDQQQRKGNPERERRNQPDQHERRHERAEDDRVPTQVVQLQFLAVGADPVGGFDPGEEDAPAGEDFDPIEIEARPAESRRRRRRRGVNGGHSSADNWPAPIDQHQRGDGDDRGNAKHVLARPFSGRRHVGPGAVASRRADGC